MNDEQPPIHTHGEKEAVMDVDLDDLEAFDRFVTWALTGIMLPRRKPEVDALVRALKEADHAVVDEFVDQLLMEVEGPDGLLLDSAESNLSAPEGPGTSDDS